MTTETEPLSPSAEPPGGLSRIVRNSTINLAAVLIGNLAAVLVLVKRLSPELLGQYYLVFSLIWIVQLVAEAGMSTMLTRRIVQDVARLKHTAAEATGLMLAVCGISFAVLFGIGVGWSALSGNGDYVPLFVAAGAACVGLQVQTFVSGVFRAFERFEYESLAKIVQAFSFAALLFAAVNGSPSDLLGAVWAFAGSNLLAGLVLLYGFRRNWCWPGCRLNGEIARDWVRESLPVGCGDVCRRVTLQIDTVLLGALAPFAAAGIYNLAYRPLGFLRLVPRVILTVLFPSFAHLARQSRGALDAALARSVRLLWMGSLPIVVGVVVCADHVVLLLSNAEYAAAATPMRLLICVVSLSYISTQFRFYLTALGRQAVFTRLSVWVLCVESAAIAALIVPWSYLGACYGVLLGELLFLIAGFAACFRLGLTGIEWKRLATSAVLAALMGSALWPLRDWPLWPLLATSAAATCGYFLLCAVCGVLTASELRRLGGLVRRRVPRQPDAVAEPQSAVEPSVTSTMIGR